VKSIIQLWYKELAEDALEFQKQAQRVSIWDNQLRENQKCLEDIVESVHRVMACQQDLNVACESIEAYQSDLETELTNLSADLDQEIEKLQTQEPTEDDYEREKTYLLAEELNHSLSQMELNLKKVVNDFNKQNESVQGKDDSNPISKVKLLL
jgi:nuclear pore complex protein Nup62